MGGGGVGGDGEMRTWIRRNEIQRDGARIWNRDGEIGFSGPDADGEWGDGERRWGDGHQRNGVLRWGDRDRYRTM